MNHARKLYNRDSVVAHDVEPGIVGRVDDEWEGLDDRETIARLKREVYRLRDQTANYYATNLSCNQAFASGEGMPRHGIGAHQCRERMVQIHELDNRPRLNTSSYVNVVFEEEEKVRRRPESRLSPDDGLLAHVSPPPASSPLLSPRPNRTSP